MNYSHRISEREALISELLTFQFSTYPFHNLALLLNRDIFIGGTCFDQAIALSRELKSQGISALLHESIVCLTGQKTHRLLRLEIEGRIVFLDPGTGWPVARILDTLCERKEFECGGVRFRWNLQESNAYVVQRHNGKHWICMNLISKTKQDQSLILNKYHSRYKVQLPFSNELRFSFLNHGVFHRISGNRYDVYQANQKTDSKLLTSTQIIELVSNYFPLLESDITYYFKGR